MTHCTITQDAPARIRQLRDELNLLSPGPRASIRQDAGAWYVEIPYSTDIWATLTRRGYDAVRCGETIRVSPSMPETFW